MTTEILTETIKSCKTSSVECKSLKETAVREWLPFLNKRCSEGIDSSCKSRIVFIDAMRSRAPDDTAGGKLTLQAE
jgi:L-2-hydroxyglutarate oxidase LhgO